MLIHINTCAQTPLYEQLRDQIIIGIASNQLRQGESLPSVRSLAADLGINFHTVNKAYSMLFDEGYIIMDRRKGGIISQPKDNDEYSELLQTKLSLAAAEAICHGITENEFVSICKQNFNKLRGTKNA